MDAGEPVSVWAVLKRWVGPIPRWPYLLVAMFFVGVGKLIEYYELLKPVERFAETALRQVSAFSPLSLAMVFWAIWKVAGTSPTHTAQLWKRSAVN